MPRNFPRVLSPPLGCLLFLLVLLALVPPTHVRAQEDNDSGRERPKIGLALGGGGARGGAHVGVLKRLEELRIPIDYLAGTSIGSIVGGLYASGLSPEEMSETIQNVDWTNILDDAVGRQSLPYRRKQETFLDLFGFEVGLSRGGIEIPAGLVAGQKFEFLLRELTMHAAQVEDFDELGIPYRAIATDLDDGAPVIIAGGDLADAMRASMAIPGYFTPAYRDGKVLVDGGVVDNLPVQVVRDMGADIIIAVDVGTPPGQVKSGDVSFFSIAMQTVSVLTTANTTKSRALILDQDLLLVPDLEGVSTLGFDKVSEAELRGLAIADSFETHLRELSVSEEEYERFLDRQRALVTNQQESIRIDQIEFVGGHRVPDEVLRRRMKLVAGDELDLELLRADLRRIYQVGEFELVDFHLRQRDGQTVLQIETRDKFWGPDYLRFGIRIQGNLKGDGGFQLNFLHRKSFINRYGAEWRNLLSFGDVLRLRTEFDQPLGYAAHFFLSPILDYTRVESGAYLDANHRVILDGDTGTAELDFGYRVGNDFELRTGMQFGFIHASFNALEGETSVRDQLGLFRARATLDDLDSEAFPRYGSYIQARADLGRDYLGSSEDYDRLYLQYIQPFTHRRATFTLNFEAGYDLDSDLPFYEEFNLGGLFRMSGFQPGQLRGDQMLRGSLVWMQRLGTANPLLGKGIYAGVSLEAGNAIASSESWQLSTLIPAGAVYVGIQSVLGPAYLAWGVAEGGYESFYVLLGHPHQIGILH